MWILLKLKGLRFNKDEFQLITHSSFGHILKSDKKSLRIKYAYFKGENKVYNNKLEKVFHFFLGELEKK